VFRVPWGGKDGVAGAKSVMRRTVQEAIGPLESAHQGQEGVKEGPRGGGSTMDPCVDSSREKRKETSEQEGGGHKARTCKNLNWKN